MNRVQYLLLGFGGFFLSIACILNSLGDLNDKTVYKEISRTQLEDGSEVLRFENNNGFIVEKIIQSE